MWFRIGVQLKQLNHKKGRLAVIVEQCGSLSLVWICLCCAEFRVNCSRNVLHVTFHLAKLEPKITRIVFAE